MRIFVLSDLAVGGAANAAFRLSAFLRKETNAIIDTVTGYPPPEGCGTWFRGNLLIERLTCKIPNFVLVEHLRTLSNRLRLRTLILEFKPDIIHVHNIHGISGWDWGLVETALKWAPVVWVMHDEWVVSGGECYRIPDLRFESPDRYYCPIEEVARRRKRAKACINQNFGRIRFVAPSCWLREVSLADGFPESVVEHIANGVDLDVFTDEPAVGTDLVNEGRGSAHPVALMVAVNADDRRKGGFLLQEVLKRWETPLTVMVVGNGAPEISNPNIDYRPLGPIHDEAELAACYRAADFLVHPALIDNLPNVGLESLACGTPIVAFRTGGMPDMVVPGETGWLSDEISVHGLEAAMLRAVADPNRRAMRERCRAFAVEHFSPELQARRYDAIHRELLANTQVR